MKIGQIARTKNRVINWAVKFPQCPPKAATIVAGAKYLLQANAIINHINPKRGRFFAPTGISYLI